MNTVVKQPNPAEILAHRIQDKSVRTWNLSPRRALRLADENIKQTFEQASDLERRYRPASSD